MKHSIPTTCPYCKTNDRLSISVSDAIAQCQRCGGKWQPVSWWDHFWHRLSGWTYTCRECAAEVPPGQLYGLFVPFLCHPCHEQKVQADLANGRVCGLCEKPWTKCCC